MPLQESLSFRSELMRSRYSPLPHLPSPDSTGDMSGSIAASATELKTSISVQFSVRCNLRRMSQSLRFYSQ
jgi:hypothetical protein